jgi:hypothetical protein
MKHYYYTFEYMIGRRKVLSGGNAGYWIVGEVNHEETKIGDIVKIIQFNISGSFASKATIIGKLEYDWDMSKPIGQRKSNEVITGVGYKIS